MNCQAMFSETFRAWMHIKAIRLFVEAVLRYGLPVNLQCFLLKVTTGKEKVLRQSLAELYANLPGASMIGDGNDEAEKGVGEFYPYVYLNVDPYPLN